MTFFVMEVFYMVGLWWTSQRGGLPAVGVKRIQLSRMLATDRFRQIFLNHGAKTPRKNSVTSSQLRNTEQI
jgi:hypothetical protein